MQVFKVPCVAESAELARLVTLEQHGRPLVSWVKDELSELISLNSGRRVRAMENPRLYSDKITEYDAIERKLYDLIDSDQPYWARLIDALTLLGDARLADKQRVCAIWVSGTQWIIFGSV